MHDHDWIEVGDAQGSIVYWCRKCGALGAKYTEIEATEYPQYIGSRPNWLRGNDAVSIPKV